MISEPVADKQNCFSFSAFYAYAHRFNINEQKRTIGENNNSQCVLLNQGGAILSKKHVFPSFGPTFLCIKFVVAIQRCI